MRFFELLNLQDIVLYVFPAVLFVIFLGMALSRLHVRASDPEKDARRVYYIFPEDLEDSRSPFPLALLFLIAGTVLWALLYILATGLAGVKI